MNMPDLDALLDTIPRSEDDTWLNYPTQFLTAATVIRSMLKGLRYNVGPIGEVLSILKPLVRPIVELSAEEIKELGNVFAVLEVRLPVGFTVGDLRMALHDEITNLETVFCGHAEEEGQNRALSFCVELSNAAQVSRRSAQQSRPITQEIET